MNQLKPIETKDTNAVYTLDGFGDLPAVQAHDENGVNYVISAWEISPEELEKLKETGIIYLSVVGMCVPPVALSADNPVEEGET